MRSNHLLVVAAALAGAVLVVAWLLSGFDARAADRTNRERDSGARASTRVDAPAPQLAPPPSSSDELERAAAAVSATEGTSVVEQTPRGFEVAPVRGARRERVRDAEVWYWPVSASEERSGTSSFARAEHAGAIDEGLAQFAQLLERETDGRWFAPRGAVGRIIARANGAWGLTEIAVLSEAPVFVVLEPEVEVRARVLDAAGAPVSGVRVALRQFWGDSSYFDHGATLSGADGVAQLRHLRHLVGGDWDFDARYALAIAEPLLASVHVEIDIVRPPSETLELRLPAVGSVQVELEAAPPESWVALEAFGFDESPDEVERERHFETWQPLEDGQARFVCVEAGRQFLVWLRTRDVSAPVDEVLRRGPSAQGEHVVLRVQATPRGATFAGRVVDEQGAPLADTEFIADLHSLQQNRREHVRRENGRTDAEGRFTFLAADEMQKTNQIELNLRDAWNASLGTARASFAAPAAGATVELGDVRLVATSVLAAGRVLDAAGQPVGRAWVDLHEAVHRTRRDGTVRTSWERRGSVVADDEGRFAVRGDSKASSIGLRARSNGESSALREFSAGASDVELRLEHVGVIAGRVQLPPSLPSEFVWLTATRKTPASDDLAPQRDQWARPDGAGEFVARGLALGAYDIRVVTAGGERVLGSVENVQVLASGETRDPRLDPLDLRALEFRTVTVLAPNGKPLSDGMVMTAANGGADVETQWFNQGKLLVGLSDPTLWVVAERCMIERFEPASGVDVVQLRPAANVRLQLQGPLEPPPEPYELYAWISGRGEPGFLVDNAADWLEVDGAQLQGAVRRAGAVTLRLQLSKGDEFVAECELSDVGPIVDTDRLQTFELSSGPTEFLEALTKAREEKR